MGIVSPFPKDIVLTLARMHGVTRFIETGTYRGETTRWAAEHFKEVCTVERWPALYSQYGPSLNEIENVNAYQGDSRDLLPVMTVPGSVYWLDGHWDGSHGTAGQHDECPVMDELRLLTSQDIILIDDARMFLCAPPEPFSVSLWPTIRGVLDALPAPMFVQIVDDVIFAVPMSLAKELVKYARSRANSFWESYARYQR